MVLATLVGAPLGAVAGLVIGNLVARRFISTEPPADVCKLGEKHDALGALDETPYAGKPVGAKERALLSDMSLWMEDPDHQRVDFIYAMLSLLWPVLSPAVYKEVLVQAKQPLEDACKMTKGIVTKLEITELDLGPNPPRIDSFRTVNSEPDELVLEAPIFWGSGMRATVKAALKLGKYGVLEVPVTVANIQVKALARISIKPLVEQLPCFGGITMSLMQLPHVDLDVFVANSADLLALPLVPEAIKVAIKIAVNKLLLYPNEMAFPIMENFGLPPPPQGMLTVTVVKGTGLKSSFFDTVDPFVELEVREGKAITTTTIDNDPNPTWNETMDFVVDDPTKQTLKISVLDEDIMSSDMVGVAEVSLKDAEFITHPGRVSTVTVALREPPPKDDSNLHPEVAPDVKEAAKEIKNDGPTDAEAVGAVVAVTGQAQPSSSSSSTSTPHKEKKLSKLMRKLHLKKPKPEEEDTGSSVNIKQVRSPAQTPPGKKGKQSHKDRLGTITGHLTLELKFTMFAVAAPVKPEEQPDDNSMTDCDSFVRLTMSDPTRTSAPDKVHDTPRVLEEKSPQYRFKMDFVNVSATSTLTLEVLEPPSMLASAIRKLPLLHKAKNKSLGYVQVKLIDVVKEGRISGHWALQEAQTGELEMDVQWLPIGLADPMNT